MKRTTIYFEPVLEVLLKTEMIRQNRPMADIVREAVREYVTRDPRRAPPGAGAFASDQADTAERVDEVLEETGFAQTTDASPRRPQTRRRSARRPKRR